MKNHTHNSQSPSHYKEKLFLHVIKDELINCRKNKILLITLSFIAIILGVILSLVTDSLVVLIIMIFLSIIFFSSSFSIKVKKKINKFGIVLLPITQYKFDDKSVWVDRSNITPKVNFNYPSLEEMHIMNVNSKYENLSTIINEFPIIFSPKRNKNLNRKYSTFSKSDMKIFDSEIDLNDCISSIEKSFKEAKRFDISLPIIKADSPMISYLQDSSLINSESFKVLEQYDHNLVQKEINRITGIISDQGSSSKKNIIDIDNLALEVSKLINKISPRFDVTVQNSEHLNVSATEDFSYNLRAAAYNYYCPNCNAERILKLNNDNYLFTGSESIQDDEQYRFSADSIMKLVDSERKIWKCSLCEKEISEVNAIKVHKMEDELFYHVFKKLLEENYKDRLNIYNHAWDELRKYQEKLETQLHSTNKEHRLREDAIRSKVRDIEALVNADEEAISSLRELSMKYNKISQVRAEEIKKAVDFIKKDIRVENDKMKKEITLMREESKNYVTSACNHYAELARIDQQQRDEIMHQQLQMQSQIANDTSKMREIEEVRAEWSGMNKKPFLGILGDSARVKASQRMRE